MVDCIFCKIIAGDMASYKVYEDDHTLAFLDIFGATDGHVMVVHKRHEDKILGYNSQEIQYIFTTVQKVAGALERAFDTKILSIGINHGEPAGVKHLHIHLMPRFQGDGGGIIQSLPGKKLQNKDFSQVADKIKHFVIPAPEPESSSKG
jgi:histidine triad (HIT) family protein